MRNEAERNTWVLSVSSLILLTLLTFLSLRSGGEILEVSQGRAYWPEQSSPQNIYHLDGEWFLLRDSSPDKTLQAVPASAWKKGIGNYTLQLRIPAEQEGKELELFIRNAGSSYRITINGKPIGSSGTYGETPETAVASAEPMVFTFLPRSGWNTITIDVSNFVHPRGGLWERVSISEAGTLTTAYSRSLAVQLLLFGNLLFIGVFHSIMALMYGRRSYFIYFAVGVICAAFGNIVRNSFSIYLLLPNIDYILVKKSQFILYYLAAAFFVRAWGYGLQNRKISAASQIFFSLSLVLTLLTLFLPLSAVYYIAAPFYPTLILMFFLMYFHRLRQIIRFSSRTALLWGLPRLIGDFLILFAAAHDSLDILIGSYSTQLIPLAIYVYAVLYTMVLAGNFIKALKRKETAKEEIINAADQERERLKSELHDHLGQLTLGIEYLAAAAIREKPGEKTLVKIRDSAVEIRRELYRIIDGLVPRRLEEVGLEQAVREMAEETRRTYVIDVSEHVDLRGSRRSSIVDHQIYSIVKESISNALQHAAPVRLQIAVTRAHGNIKAVIRNDGVSVRHAIRSRVKGHGLDIMRYRTTSLGGTFQAGVEEAEWFTVTAEIPEEQQ
jgi:signal transduction histidine kinase